MLCGQFELTIAFDVPATNADSSFLFLFLASLNVGIFLLAGFWIFWTSS
jgi:hypothetical protein